MSWAGNAVPLHVRHAGHAGTPSNDPRRSTNPRPHTLGARTPAANRSRRSLPRSASAVRRCIACWPNPNSGNRDHEFSSHTDLWRSWGTLVTSTLVTYKLLKHEIDSARMTTDAGVEFGDVCTPAQELRRQCGSNRNGSRCLLAVKAHSYLRGLRARPENGPMPASPWPPARPPR